MDVSQFETRGEAAVLDLPRRPLFVLLQGWWPTEEGALRHIHPDPWNPVPILQRTLGSGSEDWRPTLGASAPVGLDELPAIVVFDDLDRPETVRAVDPQRLEQTFGPGSMVLSAKVETTRDPVTRGVVERTLPWFKDWDRGRTLGGRFGTFSKALPDRLYPTAFARGV